jgi:DNA transposition AAA+ family ATPase
MTQSLDNRGQTAPLQNVRLFHELVHRVKDAPTHLPNWGVFYGMSGNGKTTAASHAALSTHALYLECGSTWSTGTLVDSIMHELNMAHVKGAVAKRVIEIIRVLADDPVPLIFDEADHLVKKSLVDVIREITDKSKAPVILIGEQHLPEKLSQFERAHNRVLDWVEAVPCTFKDAKELLKLYAGSVEIADDLLRKILVDTAGCTRRIVTNIDRVRNFATTRGFTKINLADYAKEVEIYRGVPQRARRLQVAS